LLEHAADVVRPSRRHDAGLTGGGGDRRGLARALADETETTVRIYSSPLDELGFTPSHELAKRRLGREQIYLGESYTARSSHDLVVVGDYAGLAAADSLVAAAIVLPESDHRPSPLRAYAAVVDA
jgi:hypothetical protein